MPAEPPVDLSTEHLTTVAAIALAIAALVTAARLRPGGWSVAACRVLAVVILVNEASWWVWLALHGQWSLGFALPLQLCDVACFATAAALWTRNRLLCELTWFWGLAGTANGLITPDVGNQHFPSYLYLQYFIAHGGIVLGAFLLVIGLRLYPRRLAALRAFGLTVVLLGFDGLVDLATGGDYLYLRRPPGVHNLLELLGPWPWYIVAAAGIALAVFLLLDLPFAVLRRSEARAPIPSPA